ncbi:hypothetical protein H920_18561 [Fukomys damarensis]|uniref:Uncharacterized protein n=1 Tax=Fukomys damarensis TaxID=885580 RepID=A0A091CRQ2_FUKDA|nr:hypothetical protein H920_18561 [Fukomys damarensis]
MFQEKPAADGFPDASLAVLLEEELGASLAGIGWCPPQGSSDPLREHHFPAPVWIPQPGGADPSSHQRRFSGSHHWPLGLPDIHPTVPATSRSSSGVLSPERLQEVRPKTAPQLAPHVFRPLPKVKMNMEGQHFELTADTEAARTAQPKDMKDFKSCFRKWQEVWAIRARTYTLLRLTRAKENVVTVYYALLISTSSLPVILTYFY